MKKSHYLGLFLFYFYIYIKSLETMKKTKKQIRITESQAIKLAEMINELNLSGDQELTNANGNVTTAAKNVITNAKRDGVNTDTAGVTVGFSNDSLKQNNIVGENVLFKTTKREINENKRIMKEKRLNKLIKESQRVTSKSKLFSK